jgi:hypothetical protein
MHYDKYFDLFLAIYSDYFSTENNNTKLDKSDWSEYFNIRLYSFNCSNHLIQAFNTCADFCLNNLFLFILQKSSILSWYIH